MGSSQTWVTIAAVVVAVVVTYFAGPQAGYMAGTLVYGVGSYYNASKRKNDFTEGGIKSAAAKELSITTATEAALAPVVFGTSRLSGNLLRYDLSGFSATATYEEQQQPSGGGKGGGGDQPEAQPVLTGYDYRLYYEVGLCMGPVDEIGRIWDGNNLEVVGQGSATWSGGGGHYQSASVAGKDFGGPIYINKGRADQVPVNAYGGSPGQNYRGVSFVALQNFLIGKQPVPRTLMFEVTRWPVCLGVDGLPVPGLRTQGSIDASGPSWYDANPAAILWEIFTNKRWGRGANPAILDVDSFVAVSEYFASNNIGITITLEEQDKIGTIIDVIRQHVSTIVIWDGVKLFCRCMMNTAAFEVAASLSSEQVNKPQFSRPAWPDMVNELRLEFTNRATGYKPELAHIQDDAALAVMEGVLNSQRLSMPGFHRRELAEQQAARMLSDTAYPAASLVFYMNRWASHILPGDLLEFVWSEWSTGAVTTYWNVAEINDNEQSADGIRVTLQENQYLTAREGLPVPIEPASPGFTGDTFNDDSDISLGEDHQENAPIADMQPVTAWELPAIMTGGKNRLAFTAEKGSASVLSLAHYASPDGVTDFDYIGATTGWAITGTLLANVPDNGRTNCRAAADAFTIALTEPANEAEILSSANKALLDSDDLAVLIAGKTDVLIIGGEIFQVGKITETSPGVYTVENYLRACFGTEIETHLAGAEFAFIPAWVLRAFSFEYTLENGVWDWQTYANTLKGQSATAWDHTSTVDGRGSRPYPPSEIDSAAVGLAYSGNFRPRFIDSGALVFDTIEKELGVLNLALPAGLSFIVQPMNGGTENGDAAPLPVTFTPDDGLDPATGVCAWAYTAPASTTGLRIFSLYNGKRSLAYMTPNP